MAGWSDRRDRAVVVGEPAVRTPVVRERDVI
jgi:hypothetical protein